MTVRAIALVVAALSAVVAMPDLHGQTAATCLGFPATIVGTPGDDVLTGTARHEVVAGLEGNDTIATGAGGDIVCGGAGRDTITTQDQPRDAQVVVDGGAGDDAITTTGIGATLHRVIGGPGDDRIDCGSPAHSLADFLRAPGPLTVNLRAGTATGEGTDLLARCGGASGSRFADELIGTDGPNVLDGGRGADRILAGAGRDALFGRAGNDHIDGGAGVDLIGFATARAVLVDLTSGRAVGEGSDRLLGLESVYGTRGADTLIGNARSNELRGWFGNDRLFGRRGNDRLVGSAGRDLVDGGVGRDRCQGEVKRRCP